MQYLYSFANVSLVLRVMHRLSQMDNASTESLTVMYLVDRWVLRLNLNRPLSAKMERNLLAFLKENGMAHPPSMEMLAALQALDQGESITQVLKGYRIFVVAHGAPDPSELQDFCTRFVDGLGYYPPSLV